MTPVYCSLYAVCRGFIEPNGGDKEWYTVYASDDYHHHFIFLTITTTTHVAVQRVKHPKYLRALDHDLMVRTSCSQLKSHRLLTLADALYSCIYVDAALYRNRGKSQNAVKHFA